MRIRGIKINNYKSFSNVQNVLRFDSENTLALIGKNESGKSNTLLALKELNFFDLSTEPSIFKNANRNTDNSVSVSFELEFDNSDFDFEQYNIKNNKSIIEFRKEDNVFCIDFDGCLSEILQSDSRLCECATQVAEFPLRSTVDSIVRKKKEKFSDYLKTVLNLNVSSSLNMTSVQEEIFKEFKEKMIGYYDLFKSVMPKIIFFSDDMILKNRYTYDSINRNDDIEGLKLLLDALNFSIEDLKKWLLCTDAAEKQKFFIMFKKKLDEFNAEFHKYYTTNVINLLASVDSKIIEFTIDDNIDGNGVSITNFSERSNGLKWYISLFIKIYSTKNVFKNSLILLDEPGNSLHVIAQKELLELLYKQNNYQLIYTTHSPYMIDINHLENIRLINKETFTTITNGINNNHSTSNEGYKETISPILDAIGLSLNYNFGPSFENVNLVVEGITDYYYIKSMIEYFGSKVSLCPNIIPCVGVTNECNIVSILIGWGYDYKCLFDNDQKGVNSFEQIKRSIEDYENKLFFVHEEYGNTIESLLSEHVKNVIEQGSKVLNAKEFSRMVNNKIEFLDEETLANFSNLFIKLGFFCK